MTVCSCVNTVLLRSGIWFTGLSDTCVWTLHWILSIYYLLLLWYIKTCIIWYVITMNHYYANYNTYYHISMT